MSTESRRSIVFHPAANLLLVMSAAFAAYMLFVFVIPGLHVERGRGWIDVWFFQEYTLFFVLFLASFGIAMGILGWRMWILYGQPTSRKSNDA